MQPYDKSFKLSQPKTEWKVSWHSYKSENRNIKDIKNITLLLKNPVKIHENNFISIIYLVFSADVLMTSSGKLWRHNDVMFTS